MSKKKQKTDLEQLMEKLQDRNWRLTSGKLYFIKDKEGRKVPFIPNEHQMRLHDNLHLRNIIPKARQLGFSTYIAIRFFDRVLFERNVNMGIIAHEKEAMKKIFDDKIRFAWDNLPDRLKDNYFVKTDSANELKISLDKKNWSSIRVALSFRS